jgi:hypothetical protein
MHFGCHPHLIFAVELESRMACGLLPCDVGMPHRLTARSEVLPPFPPVLWGTYICIRYKTQHACGKRHFFEAAVARHVRAIWAGAPEAKKLTNVGRDLLSRFNNEYMSDILCGGGLGPRELRCQMHTELPELSIPA